MPLKLAIADSKTGKTYPKELEDEKAAQLYGRKLGDKIDGGLVGLTGYELQITGGSDKEGFPLTASVPGSKRGAIFAAKGTGVRGVKKGERAKRAVRGMTLSAELAQVNFSVAKAGEKSFEDLGFALKPKEAKKDEKK